MSLIVKTIYANAGLNIGESTRKILLQSSRHATLDHRQGNGKTAETTPQKKHSKQLK